MLEKLAPNAGQPMAFEEALPLSVGRGPGKLQADKRRTRGGQERRTTARQGQAYWSARPESLARVQGRGHDKGKTRTQSRATEFQGADKTRTRGGQQ